MSTAPFCLVAILCFAVGVFAEPPVSSGRDKSIVSQRLLNRVADIIANGGDGSSLRDNDGPADGPSVVNQELLDRIARIISQNDGQLSWSQKTQGAVGEPNNNIPTSSSNNNEAQLSYGIPPVEAPAGANELAGTLFELSPPEPVPRIAAFDFNDDDDDAGYQSSPVRQDSYADNGNLYQGQQGRNKIQLGEPQSALRIASFDIEGQQPPPPYTPPQGRAGGGGGNGYSTLGSH